MPLDQYTAAKLAFLSADDRRLAINLIKAIIAVLREATTRRTWRCGLVR